MLSLVIVIFIFMAHELGGNGRNILKFGVGGGQGVDCPLYFLGKVGAKATLAPLAPQSLCLSCSIPS